MQPRLTPCFLDLRSTYTDTDTHTDMGYGDPKKKLTDTRSLYHLEQPSLPFRQPSWCKRAFAIASMLSPVPVWASIASL